MPLDELEAAAFEANQDIRLALARVDESRALARLSRADFFPQINAQPAYRRAENSNTVFIPALSAIAGQKGVTNIPGLRTPFNDFLLPLDLTYEADVWGRVRRSMTAARERSEATVADAHAVLLTVSADVAVNYFILHALDAQTGILQHTIELRKSSLELIEKQLAAGIANDLDLNRAKTELSTTEASLSDVKRQRNQVVNVIAILTGKPAASITLEIKALAGEPPEIPVALPSALLERRPDVVRAERLLAASSEDIGVSKAAYFPRFALTAAGGFESQDLTKLFNWTSTIWNFATNITQPVFTGGRNKANLDAAKARYAEALAVYREQILVAFKDVEDALVDIQSRAEQAKSVTDAIESSRKVTELSTSRYQKGQVSYFEVVDAQRQQLALEQQAAELLGQRMAAAVRLIKALGGGWTMSTGMDVPLPLPPIEDAPEK
jgi:multidrug efflux system outer membrane protein